MFGGSVEVPQSPAPARAPRPQPAPAPVVRTPAPIPAAEPVPVPAVAVKPAAAAPAVTPDPAPTAVSEAPFQASVAIGTTRCPEPVAHPNARNTPVKVYVNQQTQKIEIVSPDLPQVVPSRISTGGGLKIPNGELKKAPYCARTPRKERLIVSAVTPEMFKGSGCTEDEVRAKSTVFPMYHTRTFTDKNGKPVPMPNAVRITGGIFFHEVPPSYREMLGHNVSGECVRLAPGVARFLQSQIKKYGAIEVNITDPPTVAREMPQYCDDQMVANAKYRQSGGAVTTTASRPQPTGSEGVYGGEDSFFSVLGRIFTPKPEPTTARPARPLARTPAERPSRG